MDNSIIRSFLEQAASIMVENRDRLIDLDSVVGDGDLGLTMSDGFVAAFQAIQDSEEADAGKMLYFAGKAMSTAVPSTMGTLMASGLMQAGKVLKGKTTLVATDFIDLFQAYFDGVANRGKAKIGDKTFLDGLNPAIEALKDSIGEGKTLQEASQDASLAAQKGYEATVGMLAIHGRAATRGEASRQLLDPGAAVAALLMKAFAVALQ
ncbi:dihydroxyacetone kinase [Sphaerochaeta pleomorpha str. Grapes]|uniref:Dihydroxyacetone kinase n=1 Tax=Sphaerochaeta pleomorpha (strain ATCC BAA-1885 / DSM 22778 / Grapes) TaxID=158190 RepID=G8QU73_SPHPG|nr:DAK2 domain-containing protein [Sphaerochaeta pleomorpha]AEV28043.1 dihydroxyacetone kinase [Sphaerochaeta pleomorpha str. Grapes]